MVFHINEPRQKVKVTEVRVALTWWTGWFLITQGPPHSQSSYISTRETRCVPEVVSCTWCTMLDQRDSGPEETRSTASSFHSTHHCSLQCCTPRNNDHIVQRKWEYFHFCCFKVSIFAYSPAGLCSGVGKTSSNTNDSCLLEAQTWAALLVFGANSSILTAAIFHSQYCPGVAPKQSPPAAAEENTEHRRSEQNANFNP